MLGTDKPNSDETNRAEIAAAQHRLIQLLAKSVAERLANSQNPCRSDWQIRAAARNPKAANRLNRLEFTIVWCWATKVAIAHRTPRFSLRAKQRPIPRHNQLMPMA